MSMIVRMTVRLCGFCAFAAFALIFQGCIGVPRPTTTAYIVGDTMGSYARADDSPKPAKSKRRTRAETAAAEAAAAEIDNSGATPEQDNAPEADSDSSTAILVNAPTTADESAAAFVRAKNIVWQLTGVTFSYGAIKLDRDALTKNVYSDFFTIQFRDEGVTGTAAPNNYFAPYALLGENNSIALRMIVSTQKMLMGTINILNGLTESDYYKYAQNIFRWDLIDGTLVLHTKTDEQGDIVMTYSAGPRIEQSQ
jgi:heat shock protein HslJ